MTSKSTPSIDGNTEKPCSCCHRMHRKLYLVGGFWMGQNCAENYKTYQNVRNVNTATWFGWEAKHAQIEKMIGDAK